MFVAKMKSKMLENYCMNTEWHNYAMRFKMDKPRPRLFDAPISNDNAFVSVSNLKQHNKQFQNANTK